MASAKAGHEQHPNKITMKEAKKCSSCNKRFSNGVICDKCNSYLHFRCAGIKVKEITSIKDSWTCAQCKQHASDVTLQCTQCLDGKKIREEAASLKTVISVITKELNIANDLLNNERKVNSTQANKLIIFETTINKQSEEILELKALLNDIKVNDKLCEQNRFSKLNNLNSLNEFPPISQTYTPTRIYSSVGKTKKYTHTSDIVKKNKNATVRKVNPDQEVITTKPVLVLGDSIIKHIQNSVGDKCQVQVFPGIRADELENRPIVKNESLVTLDPSVIVLHVGTNNIEHASCADEVMGNIYNTIRVIKNRFKKAKLVVNGIVYRRDINNAYIDNINNSIRWACDNLHTVFLNTNKFLNDKCLGRDGLHLNRLGSSILGSTIKKVTDLFFQGN